jgi:hypothetical protein
MQGDTMKVSSVYHLTNGYNFIKDPFGVDFLVKPGWAFAWCDRANIAVKMPVNDTANSFWMRVFVSVPSVSSVFFNAKKLGNQTVETIFEGRKSVNQIIDVVNKLKNVTINLGECPSTELCTINAVIFPPSK